MFLDPPLEYDLNLTLEEVLNGCVKKRKIIRKIFDNIGNEMLDEKIVAIEVKPGTQEGTAFRFSRQGDQFPDSIPADIVFIARDKPHDIFTRNGPHIKYVAQMTKNTFSNGGKYMIPTLEDDEESLILDNVLQPNIAVRRFPGRGLPYPPISHNKSRGDLIVTFNIIENYQEPPVIHELYIPTEKLKSENGFKKRVKISRIIADSNGNEKVENKELQIDIPPNTEEGTRIPFPEMGDQKPGKIAQDIIFVIRSIVQDPPVFKEIGISLENVLKGFTKRLKIERQTLNKENDEVTSKEIIITLDIKPGIKEGHQFVFLNHGDECRDRARRAADIIFVIYTRPHDHYKRSENGFDLEYVVRIKENDIDMPITIPTIDSDDNDIVLIPNNNSNNNTNTWVHRIPDKGLPYPNDDDDNNNVPNVKKRGDLFVRFEIENDDDVEIHSKSRIAPMEDEQSIYDK